jgi:hypothetical protein
MRAFLPWPRGKAAVGPQGAPPAAPRVRFPSHTVPSAALPPPPPPGAASARPFPRRPVVAAPPLTFSRPPIPPAPTTNTFP